jgi:hypothetical protein
MAQDDGAAAGGEGRAEEGSVRTVPRPPVCGVCAVSLDDRSCARQPRIWPSVKTGNGQNLRWSSARGEAHWPARGRPSPRRALDVVASLPRPGYFPDRREFGAAALVRAPCWKPSSSSRPQWRTASTRTLQAWALKGNAHGLDSPLTLEVARTLDGRPAGLPTSTWPGSSRLDKHHRPLPHHEHDASPFRPHKVL